jgi:TolA-binding protein
MQQDGFKHVFSIPVDTEPYHYPNFTTEWFEPIIEFIEKNPPPKGTVAATRTSEPAVAPAAATSAPAAPAAPTAAANEPQKLLNLAKNYINAKSYPAARARLNTIIEKYPNDPAAAEARRLLQSLP